MKINKIFFPLILTGVALFPYTKYPIFSYLFFLIFIVIIGSKILISKKKLFDSKSFGWPIILLLTQLLLVLFQGLMRSEFNFVNASIDTIQRILVVVVFIMLLSNFSLESISRVLDSTVFIFFMIGLCSLFAFYMTGVRIFNENTLAFFILPYLGLQIIKNKRIVPKSLIYIIGVVILFLTGGRASLLAFLLTPLWFFAIKYTLVRNIFLVLFLLISILIPFAFMDILLQFDSELSGRGSLQNTYTLHLENDVMSFLFGTGDFFLDNKVTMGLGPHHSWLGLIFTYGLVGLIINIIITLYCTKIKIVNQESQFYFLVIFYIFTVQNFETINIGGISFMSLLLLSCLFLVKKIQTSLQENHDFIIIKNVRGGRL